MTPAAIPAIAVSGGATMNATATAATGRRSRYGRSESRNDATSPPSPATSIAPPTRRRTCPGAAASDWRR
ncbi:hypothetical protein FKB36_07360 [Methanoculleus sp. Afa-1]|uniref:Uncharacterized protein n=1 Tax=Methanoculleus formosensis TaxID=2590886 RepID=A0A9E4ZLG7_9EURY|nr:hypothetical protein [Methanoculleus sp. Afa-1]